MDLQRYSLSPDYIPEFYTKHSIELFRSTSFKLLSPFLLVFTLIRAVIPAAQFNNNLS